MLAYLSFLYLSNVPLFRAECKFESSLLCNFLQAFFTSSVDRTREEKTFWTECQRAFSEFNLRRTSVSKYRL